MRTHAIPVRRPRGEALVGEGRGGSRQRPDDGLFFGNPSLLGIQLIAVLATWVFAFVGASILLKIVDLLIGLRVEDEEEMLGLDLSQHNESAYALGTFGTTFGTGLGAPKH